MQICSELLRKVASRQTDKQTNRQTNDDYISSLEKGKERKGKEEYLYSVFWPRWYTQSAQAWITQYYLQITREGKYRCHCLG